MLAEIDFLLLISRWVHLAAAIVALGGVAFSRWALMPAAAATLTDDAHEQLREAVRTRWARLVHACIALLLLTGAINFVWLAMPPKIEPMPYHAIFGVKFLAALGVFFVAAVLVGRGPRLAKMRQNRATWLGVLLALGALIVLLSGVLNQIRSSERPLGMSTSLAVYPS